MLDNIKSKREFLYSYKKNRRKRSYLYSVKKQLVEEKHKMIYEKKFGLKK